MQTPSIVYDEAHDVAYLQIAPQGVEQVERGASKYQKTVTAPGGTMIADFGSDDQLLGIEIIGARRLLGDAIDPS